ncbi:pyridoxal-phosphate dependent enzyme [uncultured Pseudoteredinibacter sp.]|uniref:1-aminocyclopropane-1-carboxylate deaminase/D-cysteine desulfhydrase n=1 Tax=uncultured Pseudoteredinibacter sp. TaxID=1641701 RepID=UPI002629BC80|nr:pyridoxal-phosphate dependent enzyme [uncultured Pseudoteredinibacter sp.]
MAVIQFGNLSDFSASSHEALLENLSQDALAQSCQVLDVSSSVKSEPVAIEVWRLDKVCRRASGNKYFKQALYWQLAAQHPDLPLLSFGGHYSNHLYALAAEAQRRDKALICILRGLHQGELNPCLSDLKSMGARLHFVSRKDYRNKHELTYLESLQQQLGSFICVPEGGGQLIGAWGAQAIGLAAAKKKAAITVVAAGTGSTAAGIIAGLDLAAARSRQAGDSPTVRRVVIVPVINLHTEDGQRTLAAEITGLRRQLAKLNGHHCDTLLEENYANAVNWQLLDGFQFGAYGKFPAELKLFLSEFESRFQIPLDPIYTAKAMAAVWSSKNLATQASLPQAGHSFLHADEKILFIHSGGLQGRRGHGLF